MTEPVVTRYEITTEYPVQEPVTIAHVSDLHERRADDILSLLRDAHPDLICVTGDTYERYDNRPQYEFEHRPVKRLIVSAIHWANHFLRKFESDDYKAKTVNSDSFLEQAAKIAPVYMSLGNHEQKLSDRDYFFLGGHSVTLLDNSYREIRVKDFPILIGGMSSWEFEDFLADFAQKKGFKLLLSHHPERFELYIEQTDIALTLSGHTHGGQFRTGNRGRGFFVPGQGIFGKYAHGIFFGGRLIVSAGCSNTVAFPRLFNPRELVVIRLKGKSNGKI